MGALQYVATSALSLTLSGNTGVAPFLTLFLVGVIEKSDPSLLYMDGWVEKVLASWPGLVIFGVLTMLEFVGKCVPVIDEVIDSAMAFVVPIFSILGSVASYGLFTAPASASTEAHVPHNINITQGYDYDYGHEYGHNYEYDQADTGHRRLGGDGANGLLIFLQVILSTIGIVLALLVHFCKMLLRLMGEGCCTCCITTVEIAWVTVSVTLCIFIVPIAIGAAILLLIAAGFGFKSWWEKRQKKKDETEAGGIVNGTMGGNSNNTGGTGTTNNNTVTDVEQGGKGKEAKLVNNGESGGDPGENPGFGGGVTESSLEENAEHDMKQPLLP